MGSEQPTHKHESIPTWALVLEATAPVRPRNPATSLSPRQALDAPDRPFVVVGADQQLGRVPRPFIWETSPASAAPTPGSGCDLVHTHPDTNEGAAATEGLSPRRARASQRLVCNLVTASRALGWPAHSNAHRCRCKRLTAGVATVTCADSDTEGEVDLWFAGTGRKELLRVASHSHM